MEINELFNKLQPLCKAIYLGGSRVNKYIKNPHDYDYILFVDNDEDKRKLMIKIGHIFHLRGGININGLDDYMNIRIINEEEHSYGSYINKLQKKLVGEDVEFIFDIIDKNREEYINILLKTINKFENRKIKPTKRWYQILNGIFILKNNSYELTKEQIEIINDVHDVVNGWEKHLSIIKEFKEEWSN